MFSVVLFARKGNEKSGVFLQPLPCRHLVEQVIDAVQQAVIACRVLLQLRSQPLRFAPGEGCCHAFLCLAGLLQAFCHAVQDALGFPLLEAGECPLPAVVAAEQAAYPQRKRCRCEAGGNPACLPREGGAPRKCPLRLQAVPFHVAERQRVVERQGDASHPGSVAVNGLPRAVPADEAQGAAVLREPAVPCLHRVRVPAVVAQVVQQSRVQVELVGIVAHGDGRLPEIPLDDDGLRRIVVAETGGVHAPAEDGIVGFVYGFCQDLAFLPEEFLAFGGKSRSHPHASSHDGKPREPLVGEWRQFGRAGQFAGMEDDGAGGASALPRGDADVPAVEAQRPPHIGQALAAVPG